MDILLGVRVQSIITKKFHLIKLGHELINRTVVHTI